MSALAGILLAAGAATVVWWLSRPEHRPAWDLTRGYSIPMALRRQAARDKSWKFLPREPIKRKRPSKSAPKPENVRQFTKTKAGVQPPAQRKENQCQTKV